jgi:hypothetical protein
LNGQFIVKIGTDLLEFSNYNDIPDKFDNVIIFKPEVPDSPHSEDDHKLIATFDGKLKELMKRETNASGN